MNFFFLLAAAAAPYHTFAAIAWKNELKNHFTIIHWRERERERVALCSVALHH